MGGVWARSGKSLGKQLTPFLFEGWLLNPNCDHVNNMNRRVMVNIMVHIVGRRAQSTDLSTLFQFDLDEQSFHMFSDMDCFLPSCHLEKGEDHYTLYVTDNMTNAMTNEVCQFLFFAQMYYRYNMVIQHHLIMALASVPGPRNYVALDKFSPLASKALEGCNLQKLDQFLESLDHPEYDPEILERIAGSSGIFCLLVKMCLDAAWFAKQEKLYFWDWEGYTYFEKDLNATPNGKKEPLHPGFTTMLGVSLRSTLGCHSSACIPHLRWIDYFLTHVIEPADAYLAEADFSPYDGTESQEKHGWDLDQCKALGI